MFPVCCLTRSRKMREVHQQSVVVHERHAQGTVEAPWMEVAPRGCEKERFGCSYNLFSTLSGRNKHNMYFSQ